MISYPGEHYWPGFFGNLWVIQAFVYSLAAAICYFLAVQKPLSPVKWKVMGRFFFVLHAVSVAGAIGTLFYMIANHMYEYHYVWQHSNNSMPMRYIFACFWEGQEGSFMLWIFWHVVIGLLLLWKEREWEAPVMSTISLVQAFLGSMLLGIYIFDYQWGSNPFTVLTREVPEFANLPFVKSFVIENGQKVNNYLQSLDGRGLNPLLQNYWMTIHPPTLFLGFAAVVVPFAYAIGGLWTKRYNAWQGPALPWAFFGIMALGTGILMGGAWAYEALSFGGFWAWDPVENSSLVPWLTLVAGAHVMLVNKNRGHSLLSSFTLILLSFLFILYSTFLTRSGILGNTSVHSFTDLGLMRQLVVYLAVFTFISIFLMVRNVRHFPKETSDDSLWSREFWMFIGALVLSLSLLQIIFVTSFPVWNKLFGTSLAIGAEGAIKAYNRWQIPFAALICILIAVGQYFKYKNTDPKQFWRRISFSLSISFVLAVAGTIAFRWFDWSTTLILGFLLFACLFAVLANISYWAGVLKGKFSHAGASVAHTGFGLLLLGALISTSRSQVISQNYKGDVELLGKGYSNADNIMLEKNDTLRMGEYYVTYKGKKKEGIYIRYEVQYMHKDTVTGKYDSLFTLTPFIQLNERMGNAAEPDTRHFIYKDVYTHVTFADPNFDEEDELPGDYSEPRNNKVKIGDTIFAFNAIMILEAIEQITDTAAYQLGNPTLAAGARLKIFDMKNGRTNSRTVMPIYAIYDSIPKVKEVNVNDLGLKIAFWNIDTEQNKVDISFALKKNVRKDYIVMKAVVFPFINILWLGCLVMIIGTVMAIRQRLKHR